ncbi:MAG: aldo/keto reductase [Armatimonadetes bacterium]|nr:aldo/keto reductase [Armatimonadota bacterium]
MEYVEYGSTGIEVSRLCLGTGHVRGAYPVPADGGRLLEEALENGVTFWDTAEGYGSHPHVGAALRRVERSRVVIQTKTPEREHAAAAAKVDAYLQELGTDYLDVLLLHGVNSPRDLEVRAGALQALVEAKQAGKVRAVGCSTHIYTGPVMDAVTACPAIEVILATVNKGGIMLEGSIVDPAPDAPRVPAEPRMDQHIEQVRAAFAAGKGISIMKIIGQRKAPEAEWEEWITWGYEFPYAHSVNLGITHSPELHLDVRLARTAHRRIPLRQAA